MEESQTRPLFPEFERYVRDSGLLEKAEGSLSAKLPRILGQGQTRAKGLDMPPAPVERKMELSGLELSSDINLPVPVSEEIRRIREEVDQTIRELGTEEGLRRIYAQILNSLPEPKGLRDNRYFAGRLVLHFDRKTSTFTWGLTIHHPVITRVPPDVSYIAHAQRIAEQTLKTLIIDPMEFQQQLGLAWEMARQFSQEGTVLIREVARMYFIAGHGARFWKNPSKRNFIDLPPAAFVANLQRWKRSDTPGKEVFEFVPATLSQEKQAFFLPVNPEGTQAKPYIYLKRSK
jgi:hypothetical protein